MSSRPRSHVLEDESRLFLRTCLPSEWVVRDQHPDYGLDCQVEIFKYGQTTNHIFSVQLKATDSTSDGVEIDANRFHEYVEHPLPVMIAVYKSTSKTISYHWIHDVLGNSTPTQRRAWRAQKTITVTPSKLLTIEQADELLKEVVSHSIIIGRAPEHAAPFEIAVKIEGDDGNAIQRRLSAWLSKLSTANFVELQTDPPSAAPFGIAVNPERSLLTLRSGQHSNVLRITKKGKTVPAEALFPVLQLGLALLLSQNGRPQTALDLVAAVVAGDEPLPGTVAEFLLSLPDLPRLYATLRREVEALHLAERLLTRGIRRAAVNFASAVVQSSQYGEFYAQGYRRFLLHALDAFDDTKWKASICYNLGNSLRSTSHSVEAIKQYIRAARYNADYLKRSYWWAEIAGCFFLTNRFRWSERAYRRSLDLGELHLPARALMADAILHQGRFSEAERYFAEYLSSTPRPAASIVLKAWLAHEVNKQYSDRSRDKVSAISKASEAVAIGPQSVVDARRLLELALEQDPLCGLAWFNLAVCQKQMSDDPKRAWLMTAVLQEWDVEAWANTVAAWFNAAADSPIATAAIFHEAFRLHGTQMRNELATRFRGPSGGIQRLVRGIADIAASTTDMFAPPSSFVSRLL